MRGIFSFGLLAVVCSSTFSSIAFAADPVDLEIQGQDKVIPDDWGKAIEDFIATLEVKVKAKVDWSSSEISGGIRYEREMQPSYRKGFTLLTDEYLFDLAYHPEAARKSSGSVGLGLGANTALRMVFARQFEGQSAADLAKIFLKIPYTPVTNLPWNAELAKKRMKQGDFVAIQGDMNLVGSISQFKLLTPHVPVSAGIVGVLGGQFQIHVYRLSAGLFRLKVIGVGNQSAGGYLSVGFDPAELIEGWPLKKQISKRLKFTALEVSAGYGKENLVLFDYLLDLDSPDVRHAYDKFIQSLLTLETLKLMRPNGSAEEIQANIVDIGEFDRIFDREKNKSVGLRTVDRMFKGDSKSSGPYFNLRFGHKDFMQFSLGGSERGNFLSAIDNSGARRHFYLPTDSNYSSFRLLFGAIKEEVWQTAMFLFEANEKKEIGDRGEITFYTDFRDNRFDPDEIRKFQDRIRKTVPKSVFDAIEWGNWAENNRTRITSRVTSLLVLRPTAFKDVQGWRPGDFYFRLLDYAKSLPALESPPSDMNDNNSSRIVDGDLESKYMNDFLRISYAFAKAFDPAHPGKDRADSFLALRRIPVFQEIGSGFIASLIGEDNLRDHVYFETTWSARDSDTVHFIHGSCRGRRLYQAILNIYAVLNNRALDMRLIDDANIPEIPGKSADCE